MKEWDTCTCRLCVRHYGGSSLRLSVRLPLYECVSQSEYVCVCLSLRVVLCMTVDACVPVRPYKWVSITEWLCLGVCLCLSVCFWACARLCVRAYQSICMPSCVCVCVCVCVCLFMSVSICVYVFPCVCDWISVAVCISESVCVAVSLRDTENTETRRLNKDKVEHTATNRDADTRDGHVQRETHTNGLKSNTDTDKGTCALTRQAQTYMDSYSIPGHTRRTKHRQV
jgi:hypothetical protein